MKLEPFLMERMQSTWEHRVAFNLSESGVDPMTVRELLDGTSESALLDEQLIYTQSNGSDELRRTIAALYAGAGQDHVEVTTGCAEANHLAVWHLVEPGDEVVMPSFTFVSTANAFVLRGARPVFVDIQAHSFNLDPRLIRAAITPRTRAILPVHLFGQPADMDEILALADEHGLLVIEDCAQSFGSRYRARMTGSIGCAGAFSFFPSKNLGCYGDGGMITSNDDNIAAQIKILRNHGSSQQYHHDVIGYNSRLDELQAVILRIKLRRIDAYNHARLRVARLYNELLAGAVLQTPAIPDDRDHVFHQYTLLCDDRERLRARLLASEIACAVYYPIPLHRQQAFADTRQPALPVTESSAERCLSLPIFPELTEAQVHTVCETILGAA